MIRITIQYPPTKAGKAAWNRRYGLNAYYAGKHYQQRKRDAKDLHMLTWAALRRAGIKKHPISIPVEIRFYWDDGLDIDNHAVVGKAVVDALKGWVLQDDSPRWVRKVSHEFWGRGKIGVEVVPCQCEKTQPIA